MKKYLITSFIILNSIIAYCQHSYKQDLRSEAQITFPDTPKAEFANKATYYIYRNSKNDLYFAQVIDLNKIDLNSLSSDALHNIYSQFIDSAIKPLRGAVFHINPIKAGRLKGISFNYKCELKGDTYFCYQQAFRVEDAIVSYSLLSPDSLQNDDKTISSFFDTFILTPGKADALDKKSSLLAGILIIVGILFWSLVILAIKKYTKKKTYEWPNENPLR
jgi:hypothetical protein